VRLNPRTGSNLVKLVIFAVLTGFVTLLLGITIANGGLGGATVTYRADFKDVTSLIPGDDVRVAGVRVGQVKGIKIVDDRNKCPFATPTCLPVYAEVTFVLQKSVPLFTSARAVMRYRNLVGQRFVEIQESPGPAGLLPSGGLIPLSQTSPALNLTDLFNGFKPLFQALSPQDVNAFSYDVIQTLQGEGGTIDQLLTNSASLTTTIADRDALIGQVINNLDGVLGTVDAHDQGLDQLIVQLQRLVTGLAQDRGTIAASLGNINSLAVSTAQLISDIRPPLPADLFGLSSLANSLATTKNKDGKTTLDEFLTTLPDKLNRITSTATYGSWFNFYLCNADYAVQNPNGTLTYSTVRLHVNAPACNAGGG